MFRLRPGHPTFSMDEAVAGDGGLDHFFEAMVVVGEGDGAQLCGVRRASTGKERAFCEGALGGLGGGHAGAHVVNHGAQTVNVLGLVATSLAGLALRGAEAVASFPGAQGGGGYSQFIGHGGHGAGAVDVRRLRQYGSWHGCSLWSSSVSCSDSCVFEVRTPQEGAGLSHPSCSKSYSRSVHCARHSFLHVLAVRARSI